VAPCLGHSATQKHVFRHVFRGFVSSRLLLEPLLTRDTGGPVFGVLDDPETHVSAYVSLAGVPSCARCPQCNATLPLVCGGFAVHLGGCT